MSFNGLKNILASSKFVSEHNKMYKLPTVIHNYKFNLHLLDKHYKFKRPKGREGERKDGLMDNAYYAVSLRIHKNECVFS